MRWDKIQTDYEDLERRVAAIEQGQKQAACTHGRSISLIRCHAGWSRLISQPFLYVTCCGCQKDIYGDEALLLVAKMLGSV